MTNILKILESLKFKKSETQEQVSSMYVLGLEGKSEVYLSFAIFLLQRHIKYQYT